MEKVSVEQLCVVGVKLMAMLLLVCGDKVQEAEDGITETPVVLFEVKKVASVAGGE